MPGRNGTASRPASAGPRLLVLGGGAFVGRAVVHLARTTYSWERRPSHPPGVEHIVGDRRDRADLAALGGRRWEAVVDTWRGDAAAVRLLAGQVNLYAYVSSLTVYRAGASPSQIRRSVARGRFVPGPRCGGDGVKVAQPFVYLKPRILQRSGLVVLTPLVGDIRDLAPRHGGLPGVAEALKHRQRNLTPDTQRLVIR